MVTLSDVPRVVLVQIRHGGAATPAAPSLEMRLTIVECQFPEGEGKCSILAADFFDDESIIVVYRAQNDYSECCASASSLNCADDGGDYLSRFDYHELEYLTLGYTGAEKGIKSWEELTRLALDEWRAGRVSKNCSENIQTPLTGMNPGRRTESDLDAAAGIGGQGW